MSRTCASVPIVKAPCIQKTTFSEEEIETNSIAS